MKDKLIDLLKNGYSIEFKPDFDAALFQMTLSKPVDGDILHIKVKILIKAVDLASVDLIDLTLREQEIKIVKALENHD